MPPDGGSGADQAPNGEASPRVSLRPLRPYQAKAIGDARAAYRAGKRAILIVLPTGGGKTRVFCEFVAGAVAKGGDVLVLAHREELLTQAQAAIMAEGVSHVGIIAPWARRQNARVQVASVQTIVAQSRKDRALPKARLVIFDEAHHAAADEWMKVAKGITDENGNPPLLIGVTATPERGDGKAMGTADGGLFDELITASSVRELQELGVLVPCVTYAPETKTKALVREPWQAYQEQGAGERCFTFCVSVAHAESVAGDFRAHGYAAATIHADTPWKLRTARLEAFKHQEVAPLRRAGSPEPVPLVLCNVYTLTEGVDVTAASVCITARGIGHGGMMRQMVGRVLRAHEGKTRAIWWDLRGQCHKPKIGLPEADCTYSLEGKAITVTEAPDDPPRTCKTCGGVFMTWAVDRATGTRCCPVCRAEAPPILPPEVVEREVFAIGSGATERDMYDAIDRLAITAADRGYRSGWISVRFSEQFSRMPPRGSVDAAMMKARKTLGIHVTDGEIQAERERLYAIAREKNIPVGWVEKKIAEKYGDAA